MNYQGPVSVVSGLLKDCSGEGRFLFSWFLACLKPREVLLTQNHGNDDNRTNSHVLMSVFGMLVRDIVPNKVVCYGYAFFVCVNNHSQIYSF